MVRNGYHPQREVQTGIGSVTVQIPKVRSRDGVPVAFRSALVPPYVRKTATLEALAVALSKGAFHRGDGSGAGSACGGRGKGLSQATVSRLKHKWAAEYDIWRKRDLGGCRWAYVWADGIYSNIRGDNPRLCVLVVIGVNERGEKRFLAIEDGIRESKQSWHEVLMGLRERRG